MKKYFFFVLCTMLAGLLMTGCSSDDEDSASLYNTWVLVSYGNESNEVLKEVKGYYYQITFRPDGTYSGKAYGNDMWGEFSLMASGIQISHPGITKVDWEGSDPDKFFLQHLSDVSTYSITDTELRLYYSKDQYFKFRLAMNFMYHLP